MAREGVGEGKRRDVLGRSAGLLFRFLFSPSFPFSIRWSRQWQIIAAAVIFRNERRLEAEDPKEDHVVPRRKMRKTKYTQLETNSYRRRLTQLMAHRNNCMRNRGEKKECRKWDCQVNNGEVSRKYPPSNWITSKLLLGDWNGNPTIKGTMIYEKLDIQKTVRRWI